MERAWSGMGGGGQLEKISLLWCGGGRPPMEDAFLAYRKGQSCGDTFQHIQALGADLKRGLATRKANAVFLNLAPAEIESVLTDNECFSPIDAKRPIVIVPAYVYSCLNADVRTRFAIKPYMFIEAQSAVRSLPRFIEEKLNSLER